MSYFPIESYHDTQESPAPASHCLRNPRSSIKPRELGDESPYRHLVPPARSQTLRSRSTPAPRLDVSASSKTGAARPTLSRSSTYAWKNGLKTPTSFRGTIRGSTFWRRLGQSVISDTDRATDPRLWYNQFTSVDWIHDRVAESYRLNELSLRRGLRGRFLSWLENAQDWIVAACIGFVTAAVAYLIVTAELALFDLKFGYCSTKFLATKALCCPGADAEDCEHWISWASFLGVKTWFASRNVNFMAFILWMSILSAVSCLLTLTTRIVTPYKLRSVSLQDTNSLASGTDQDDSTEAQERPRAQNVLYSAAGSGVAEVRVILSGFILHGYLGIRTLVMKTFGLIMSVASGLTLGKEGPLVHIATCIGNVICRLLPKYNRNEGKMRELLAAAAASGVTVAFGAPLSGVLFGLEEVSYYFPPQTLFRTFFCSLTAALSLKFLDPYATSKIVLFQVQYVKEWNYLGMIMFVFLGILGGAVGALFIKLSRFWTASWRKLGFIQKSPLIDVLIISLLSGALCFWNRYTNIPVAQLMLELASPCQSKREQGTGLCPSKHEIPVVISSLLIAFMIKTFLTVVTFGLKIPAGIYVPAMVMGGFLGRIVGHIVQYYSVWYPESVVFSRCSAGSNLEGCVVPGTYALLAAGATMCGVTRLTITLAVILFELTGSLNYVLPFSVSIFVAKWTADLIEPLSIYDVQTQQNRYPFLDNKSRPNLVGDLSEITPFSRPERVIDITSEELVSAAILRRKLDFLQDHDEFDGGLPIISRDRLVGLISCPDLEFALDRLDGKDTTCILSANASSTTTDDSPDGPGTLLDLRPFIDPAPVSLDLRSPLELVYECFSKLGLRYLCVLDDGDYVGLLHKKAFVHYINEGEIDPS